MKYSGNLPAGIPSAAVGLLATAPRVWLLASGLRHPMRLLALELRHLMRLPASVAAAFQGERLRSPSCARLRCGIALGVSRPPGDFAPALRGVVEGCLARRMVIECRHTCSLGRRGARWFRVCVIVAHVCLLSAPVMLALVHTVSFACV